MRYLGTFSGTIPSEVLYFGNMNRMNRIIAGPAIASALLVSCAHSETAQATRNATAQNTIETHTPDLTAESAYLQAPNLGSLPIRSVGEYTVGNTSNRVIDMTSGNHPPINTQGFRTNQAIVQQLIQQENNDGNTQEVVYPNGSKQLILRRFVANLAVKHTFIFIDVEKASISPYTATKSSVTVNMNNQTTSLILVEDGSSRPLPRVKNTDRAMNTELCQAQAVIETKNQPDLGARAVLQEAYCNGVGFAISAQQSGTPYSEYAQAVQSLDIIRDNFKTAQVIMPETVYTRLPQLGN